jgi:1,2-phenylacetyl-CoA epoxidase catalytic subunit
MPIITYQDEYLLSKIDVELSHILGKLARDIDQLASQENKLGDMYQSYTKDLGKYVRKMRDKSKQMEVLAREDRSGIEDADVAEYKDRIANVDDQIKMIEGYFDRIKDLALQKGNLTKRMVEYGKMMIAHAKLRKDIVDVSLKIEKEKNKMVAAEAISKAEDKMKDLGREFDRSKKDLGKKWDQLVEERKEVNQLWQALKKTIDNFE